MAQFRAKRLDLGSFVNIGVIRDHTKRKVFEKNEVERYAASLFSDTATRDLAIEHVYSSASLTSHTTDKLSDMSLETPSSLSALVQSRNFNSRKCTATPGRHKSEIDASWEEKQEVSSEISGWLEYMYAPV
ncbi:hypothetical protein CAC42_7433 [Sphaceloma murrayae]|uniref:Uncharacterized protein n=1 Tax=Sphaceloma murrayae TaxID=2082308 RepID=A0A2K1QX49_9PEZI|nr:hypothetical protein CAC42_7433 [Sphaceloma murrayae]